MNAVTKALTSRLWTSRTPWMAAVVLFFALVAFRADAAPRIHLICALGTMSLDYDPGIPLLFPRQTQAYATGPFGACTSLSGSTIKSGQGELVASGRLSCIGGTFQGGQLIVWDDGTYSQVNITSGGLLGVGLSAYVLSGAIVDGTFKGATVTETLTLGSFDLFACFSDAGLTNLTGPVTLQILSL